VSGATSSAGGKKIRDVALAAPLSPPEPPKEPAKDENNIGNKLLKKMGWSEGTGLGLSGEGRVEPMFVPFLTFFFYDIADVLNPRRLQSNRHVCIWGGIRSQQRKGYHQGCWDGLYCIVERIGE